MHLKCSCSNSDNARNLESSNVVFVRGLNESLVLGLYTYSFSLSYIKLFELGKFRRITSLFFELPLLNFSRTEQPRSV